MRIGKLGELTGIAPRMLRYYEQQGLLVSTRESNGYRHYGEDQIAWAIRARSLIQSGLSTRMTRVILALEHGVDPAGLESCADGLVEELSHELTSLEERLACLTKSRATVAQYLQRATQGVEQRAGR